MSNKMTAGVYFRNIEGWHDARNLIEGSTDQAQFVKLTEELGELAGNIARGKCVKDDIGDMMVILTNIARRNGHTPEDCLEAAWNDIKHRKGKMVDGVFIKEEDLVKQLDKTIPMDATHVNQHGQYLKKVGNFWYVYADDAWKTMSGEPIGELLSLTD